MTSEAQLVAGWLEAGSAAVWAVWLTAVWLEVVSVAGSATVWLTVGKKAADLSPEAELGLLVRQSNHHRKCPLSKAPTVCSRLQ